MAPRPNRFTVDIYSPENAEFCSTLSGVHWVTITGQGGCELTIYAKSPEHAAKIAAAINDRPIPVVTLDDGLLNILGSASAGPIVPGGSS